MKTKHAHYQPIMGGGGVSPHDRPTFEKRLRSFMREKYNRPLSLLTLDQRSLLVYTMRSKFGYTYNEIAALVCKNQRTLQRDNQYAEMMMRRSDAYILRHNELLHYLIAEWWELRR